MGRCLLCWTSFCRPLTRILTTKGKWWGFSFRALPATCLSSDSLLHRHWCDQSQKFYSTYLAKRTLILASLEKEGDLKLVTTNRQLTELRSFFEHRRFGRYKEGLDIVARLGLLPFTQEELNEKQSNYRDLDPILKKQFPTFLAGSVHCLYGLHRKVKSESRGQDSSVEVRLKELQMKYECNHKNI